MNMLNKCFAFTIFDDTDNSTIENIKPMYDLLCELGIKTTKSIWMYDSDDKSAYYGESLENSEYLQYVLSLKEKGFEIASHNARAISSKRDITIRALEGFKGTFGDYPKTFCNHENNVENIYWGASRVDIIIFKLLVSLASRRNLRYFKGDDVSSEYYWGDYCSKYIKYVRNYCYSDINLLNITKNIVFHDKKRPLVKYWFISSDGRDVNKFNSLLSERNQDKLKKENGICIVYTHFASGFCSEGKVNPRTKELLERMANKNGWFVPVSELLDYLVAKNMQDLQLKNKDRFKMQMLWLANKLFLGAG